MSCYRSIAAKRGGCRAAIYSQSSPQTKRSRRRMTAPRLRCRASAPSSRPERRPAASSKVRSFYFDRLVRGRGRVAASRVLQQPTSGPSDAVARALHTRRRRALQCHRLRICRRRDRYGRRLLRSRHADVAVAGGSDALCRLTYSGFNVLQAVDPTPCSPFAADAQRNHARRRSGLPRPRAMG